MKSFALLPDAAKNYLPDFLQKKIGDLADLSIWEVYPTQPRVDVARVFDLAINRDEKEPVLVMQCGRKKFLVNGHHRLFARAFQHKMTIRAIVFRVPGFPADNGQVVELVD